MENDRKAAIQAAMVAAVQEHCAARENTRCRFPSCGCIYLPEFVLAGFTLGVEFAQRAPTPLPKDVPAGFVRVRIAVVVNHEPDGSFDWFAIGRPGASDGQLSFDASYDWPTTARVAFITADVPRPDAPTEVAGQVEVPNAE